MQVSVSIAVAGASGYAGGEILRMLLEHPEAELGTLTAHSSAGERLGAHHPHLAPLADRRLTPTTASELSGHDVVILALPHGASGPIAAELGEDTLVLDCGADHRLTDPASWRSFYGSEHAGSWPYGLPELIRADGASQRDQLTGTSRVAVPGCNVTAVTLGIAPGVAAGLIDTSGLVAVLANGYSGAGKALKPHLLAAHAIGSAQPYAVGGSHRHIPEIEQNLLVAGAKRIRLSFTPTLVPMARGILATISAPVVPGADPDRIRDVWLQAYADEPFVQVLHDGQWPTTAATVGSNCAQVQVAHDERAGRVVAICALDNLGKGTAGAAIQSMNLALGLPETLGLPTTGVAP